MRRSRSRLARAIAHDVNIAAVGKAPVPDERVLRLNVSNAAYERAIDHDGGDPEAKPLAAVPPEAGVAAGSARASDGRVRRERVIDEHDRATITEDSTPQAGAAATTAAAVGRGRTAQGASTAGERPAARPGAPPRRNGATTAATAEAAESTGPGSAGRTLVRPAAATPCPNPPARRPATPALSFVPPPTPPQFDPNDPPVRHPSKPPQPRLRRCRLGDVIGEGDAVGRKCSSVVVDRTAQAMPPPPPPPLSLLSPRDYPAPRPPETVRFSSVERRASSPPRTDESHRQDRRRSRRRSSGPEPHEPSIVMFTPAPRMT